MHCAKLVIFNYVTLLIICAQKSARELVGFLAPNKFYYLYLHRNCEDRHDEFIRIVLVDMLDTVSYILINTIYYYVLGRGDILCVKKSQLTYIKKSTDRDHGDKPVGTGIRHNSANIAPFFIPDKRRSPHKRALMTICCDLHGKEKPLSSPSQEIVDSDFRHGRILAIREEEQGHF